MAFNIDTSDYFQIYFLFENLLPREEERETQRYLSSFGSFPKSST